MADKELLSTIFIALITSMLLVAFSSEVPQVRALTNSLGSAPLPPPDYDSGLVNLPKAIPWDNPGTIIYPDDVTPTDTSLNHNLGTYNILVQVLADDGQGRYVQMPNPLVGGYAQEDNWFLTSPNQIMLRNWDYTRAVPVHVMMWRPNVQITFGQTGLTSDFTGTVLTVDADNYGIADLPVSFWWNPGSSHSFAYQSPLLVTANAKQYLWTSTNGLSTLQGGSIAVASSGSITGNYKTQYYLTVTSPYDSPSPLSGWFDSGTHIDASVTSPADESDGTRYRCTGYSGTGSVGSGSGSLVSFDITAPSTLTWNWIAQYYFTVASPYDTPTGQGWYDSSSTASSSVTSPVSGGTGVQYVATGYTGTGSAPSGSGTSVSFPITQPSTLTWDWKNQHLLTVLTDPSGLSPQPTRNPVGETGFSSSWWYDEYTVVTVTAQSVTGYSFSYWDADGSSQGSGVNPAALSMDAPHIATAHYTTFVPSKYTIIFYTYPANVGSITFDGMTYANGQSGQYAAGSYSVSANTPQGWTFDHWETTEDVTISSPAKVAGDGTITAIFKSTPATPPVGGEWVPIDKLQLLAPWISSVSLMAVAAASFVYVKRRKKQQN